MSRPFTASLGICALALFAVAPAAAALRSPQVPVLGGGLQAYFNSVGENISVGTDQDATQSWSTNLLGSSSTYEIELGPKAPGISVGFYDSHAASPVLYEIFPAESDAGWFAVVSFRTAPVRAIVSLFDESAGFRGQQTFLGADRTGTSYYLAGADGVHFVEDARNPGGRAQFLVYAGTGVNRGNWWIAGEESAVAGGGSDQDFDDVILFPEHAVCSCTPVAKSTWGALKAYFR